MQFWKRRFASAGGWSVTKSKRKGYFPIHLRRCTTCSSILLGKSATHLVLFHRLDSFNEIPGPRSVGLSGVSGVYFSLDYGGILVEKFVGLKEILNIDRVFAYTNRSASIGLIWSSTQISASTFGCIRRLVSFSAVGSLKRSTPSSRRPISIISSTV